MSRPTLVELQRWMKSRIRPGAAPDPEERVAFHPQAGDPGRERLSVYADGYLARVQEGLLEVYPSVRHVLGEKGFWELSKEYAAAEPSREYNLSFVGRHLARFLRGSERERRYPFLADLAGLEWKLCESFHAEELEPAGPWAFAQVSPEDAGRLRLRFQPSVKIAASEWPVHDIWRARNDPPGATDVVLEGRPQRVLVHRALSQVACQLLSPEEHLMLGSLLEGLSIEEACARLADAHPDADPPVAEWFAGWIQKNLLAAPAP